MAEPNRPARPKAATTRTRRTGLDPQGRRALFETPVEAARDTIRQGPAKEGREALFTSGKREPGSVVVECGSCQARTRISITEVAMRLVGTAWIPIRRHAHWMRCPACGRRTWCRIGWVE